MAVSALELRPRNAIALFDAALRVCATSQGVWALTLPAGAFLVATLFNLVDAITRNHDLFQPVLWWTGAWMVRAVSQGAACHYVEQKVLGTASVRASLLAALKRAPGLISGAAYLLVLNSLLLGFTLGIGFLFVGAHTAAYAALMRGQGGVLGLYGTTARFLGPTRHLAPWVRLCGLSQLILGLNLHLAVAGLFAFAHSMLGFDVSFADRFASLDNPVWLATLVALTFSLFEPIRAATASLMLIDGRVRQEGLDLIAQVEQLPRHTRPRGAAIVTALAVALLAAPALASGDSLARRAKDLKRDCRMSVDLSPLSRDVPDDEQSALSRLLTRVERVAYENEDCQSAEADLREGLRLYRELQTSAPEVDARGKAKEILSRPEFETVVDKPKDETPEDPKAPDEPGWLAKLFKAFLEWLEKLLKSDKPKNEPIEVPTGGTDIAGANVVMITALVVVAAVLVFILLRSLKKGPNEDAELDSAGTLNQQRLEEDGMSALSKPPETWAGLADELAAKGLHREAIRHLYLALLSRLHRDGAIDYDPTHSNWEYLFAFKGSSFQKTGFRDLTSRFDFAWYGNLGVDADAWLGFRRTAEPLLVPPQGEAANG